MTILEWCSYDMKLWHNVVAATTYINNIQNDFRIKIEKK